MKNNIIQRYIMNINYLIFPLNSLAFLLLNISQKTEFTHSMNYIYILHKNII